MICPKCGKELKDGHMYCEACGEEINLVPEFETAVEESIAEQIQSMVGEVNSEDGITPQSEDVSEHKHFFWLGGIVCVLIFMISAVFFGVYTVYKHSSLMQEIMVEYHLEDGKYNEAITYLEDIIKTSPDKTSLRFKLCEIYMDLGQEEKALEMYKTIVNNPQYGFEVQLAAAEHVVDYYIKKEDYEELADYLNTVQNRDIQLVYLEYMISPVEFSQPEGTYASLITLKLSAEGIGDIFYTTDGSVPTSRSEKFYGTIFMEAGENQISAVFINQYGVSSDVVSKEYIIESTKVSPPEVVTYSGDYNCPVKIEILTNRDTTIYYTTDGSSPSRNSQRYTGALYAPIGSSTYKFIAVDARGEVSEIVTRDYKVTLDTTMTIGDAQNILEEYLKYNGQMVNENGNLMMDETHYLICEYLYPMTKEVGKDCYYFAEVSRDITTLEQYRTNKYYGVDIRTKEIYVFTP